MCEVNSIPGKMRFKVMSVLGCFVKTSLALIDQARKLVGRLLVLRLFLSGERVLMISMEIYAPRPFPSL